MVPTMVCMRETAELYRRWSGTMTPLGVSRDVAAEHRRLMEAVLAGDADVATALLTEHINLTAALLDQYVAEHERAAAAPVTPLPVPPAGDPTEPR